MTSDIKTKIKIKAFLWAIELFFYDQENGFNSILIIYLKYEKNTKLKKHTIADTWAPWEIVLIIIIWNRWNNMHFNKQIKKRKSK